MPDFVLPAMAPIYNVFGYEPPHSKIPPPLEGDLRCEQADEVLGRCELPAHPKHDLHRVVWDGCLGSWRETNLVIIHPV
jgi:hypothetical protein